jgi:hypothetical protein
MKRQSIAIILGVVASVLVAFLADASLTPSPGTTGSSITSATSLTAGANGGTGGTLILNGATAGAVTRGVPATVTSYTLTEKSTVPAQGDILDFSNATGQISSLADVAVGQVLASGGVSTVPAYSATPTLGAVGTTGILNLAGTTSGVISIQPQSTAGTYNLILPTSAGAIGALLTSGGGSSQQVWLADGATGTILTGTGVTAIPAFSATPTISGTLIDQASIQVSATTADIALATTNGGHISTLIGAGAIPTIGTGTVTAISTDNAGEATGATSPATVTFHTGFNAKPSCVCNDETAALGACKVVPNSNGLTMVVTTTGTDSFMWICVGH